MNIIITNIGRRGYLVEYFKQLSWFTGKVFVSDCDKTASGLYGKNDGRFILPKPVEDERVYVQSLMDVCHEHKIGLIVPVIDPEIYILSSYRDQFMEKKIRIAVSSRDVLDICYDKTKMNQFLQSIGFNVPKTYTDIQRFHSDFSESEIDFPVILKPIRGSGSVDTYVCHSLSELDALYHHGMMIQKLIVGEEYGVDVFNDFKGRPLRCVVKKKLLMRSGETDKSLTIKMPDIQQTILCLAAKLGHVGNLDCDVIKGKEGIYVIDMNPRFGGGYPATHSAGVNLLELLLKITAGENVLPSYETYEVGVLVMKGISVITARISEIP